MTGTALFLAKLYSGSWPLRETFRSSTQGDDFIPLYALNPDDNGRPRKKDAEILNIIRESRAGRGLAFWFAGLNRFLGDVRPQDFLAVDPEQVLATARDEISVVQHG